VSLYARGRNKNRKNVKRAKADAQDARRKTQNAKPTPMLAVNIQFWGNG
jgi:hypothetical protein